ncbi:hypothetical protein MUK42_36514 [Musa troglodytarum]|uniref:Uncharacterized protein n=1 Tax=Musa troglodytarum TaxID=320322 RepID=A0A9E7GFD6_9LILI|nr:hypothetical protein MUK42_36514 [Musa troglodytarum]
MGGGDPLEEDFGCGRIDVGIHPFGPRSQPLVEGHQPIHVLVNLVSISHIVPSAPQNCFLSYRVRRGEEELWGSVRAGLTRLASPLCVHQCHVLKTSTSTPSQAAPDWMESSLSTRPMRSSTMSTRTNDDCARNSRSTVRFGQVRHEDLCRVSPLSILLGYRTEDLV